MRSFFLGLLLIVVSFATQSYAEEANDFYSPYAATLRTYVSENGGVDYANLKANSEQLDAFLKSLEKFDAAVFEKFSEAEKIAFWVNAYNALTLKSVIKNYPIRSGILTSLVYPKDSIRQVRGVWDETRHLVLGRRLTLNEIEHEILRKEFSDPGIHMALVCAAKSCPKLRTEPFRGASLKAQFDTQAKEFFADPHNFKIDRESETVYFSAMFDWFNDDFVKAYGEKDLFEGYGRKERAILTYAAMYLAEEDKEYLQKHNLSISFLDYDWSLNDWSPSESESAVSQ